MKICPSSHSWEPTSGRQHHKHEGTILRPSQRPERPGTFHPQPSARFLPLFSFPNTSADFRKLISIFHVHTCNKHRLCNWSSEGPVAGKTLQAHWRSSLKFRQSFQSARPISGSLCGPRWCGCTRRNGRRCSNKQGCCFFHMTVKGNHLV